MRNGIILTVTYLYFYIIVYSYLGHFSKQALDTACQVICGVVCARATHEFDSVYLILYFMYV